MESRDLIRMANQIAAFHGAYPHDQAVEAVARHLKDFWDPRMRAELATLVADGGTGLQPLALEAARRLSAEARRIA